MGRRAEEREYRRRRSLQMKRHYEREKSPARRAIRGEIERRGRWQKQIGDWASLFFWSYLMVGFVLLSLLVFGAWYVFLEPLFTAGQP